MKIAIISDIHGNLEALEQVLADIDQAGIETIYCLGDMIGYGAHPNEVIRTIRERDIPTIMGNHELAVADPLTLSWFNPKVRDSLKHTIKALPEETIAFLRSLPKSMSVHDALLVHGFPPNSPLLYLFQASETRLRKTFTNMTERICFVGHTHYLEIIGYDGTHLRERSLKKGSVKLSPDKQYIVNVGSVGQPRDGNNNAKYLVWDLDRHAIEIRYISYDIAKSADAIIVAGLPESHAKRLF